MADKILKMFHNASAASASVKIKNAMNPIVKVLLYVMPLLVGTILFGNELWIRIFSAAVAFLIVAVALGAYVYFMLRNPQMLQSEEYQIQRKALEIIQQQGIEGHIGLDSAAVISIENADVKAIAEGGAE